MINLSILSLKTVFIFLGTGIIAIGPIIYSVSGVAPGGGNKLINPELSSSRDFSGKHESPILNHQYPEKTQSNSEIEKRLKDKQAPYSPPLNTMGNIPKLPRSLNEEEGVKSQVGESQLRQPEAIEEPLSLDITKPEHKNYQQFISNLLSIIEGAIGTNKPYRDLGIDQVFAEIPIDKFSERASHIKYRRDNYVYPSIESPRLLEDPSTKVDIFNIAVNSANMYGFKPSSGWKPSEQLVRRLQSMSNLVHTFLTEDGSSKRDKSKEGGDSKFILSPFSVRTSKQGDSKGFWIRNVIRFVRAYEGKYYYLDVYFTNGMERNMLRSNYVYYRDKNWKEGAYYQANGDGGYYGKNIGGDGRFLWGKRRSGNNIDTEFSTLFDSKPERSKLLGKGFEIISRCLKEEECHETLQSTSYSTLSQREIPISRDDSYKGDIYKRIHPFSRIYYDVEEKLNREELIFPF